MCSAGNICVQACGIVHSFLVSIFGIESAAYTFVPTMRVSAVGMAFHSSNLGTCDTLSSPPTRRSQPCPYLTSCVERAKSDVMHVYSLHQHTQGSEGNSLFEALHDNEVGSRQFVAKSTCSLTSPWPLILFCTMLFLSRLVCGAPIFPLWLEPGKVPMDLEHAVLMSAAATSTAATHAHFTPLASACIPHLTSHMQ
jgi:hypothetical protein